MRRGAVLPGDLSCTARALLAVPAPERRPLCRQILAGSLLASEFLRRTGRLHPRWGNGTLMAAARCFPLAPEPDYSHAAYRCCTIMVLEALAAAADPHGPA